MSYIVKNKTAFTSTLLGFIIGFSGAKGFFHADKKEAAVIGFLIAGAGWVYGKSVDNKRAAAIARIKN
ncbi:MAG: hypothetical protein V4547_17815 [Bacteroidota bacterium]